MPKLFSLVLVPLAIAVLGPTSAHAQNPVIVAEPARGGAVDGVRENSDVFIWRLLTQFAAPVSSTQASPVVFETWASDADTFSKTPHWPESGAPMRFHASVLAEFKRAAAPEAADAHRPIDVPCSTPGNAPVGGFPTSGNPAPCIGEQTKRNRPMFDYIVNNGLNTQAGLAAAFAKSFKVEMPPESIAVKGDWVPVQTLVQWIPGIGGVGNVAKLYHTATVDSVEYALVSLHVSSRQNPNWVWGTFEHHLNPGRCDFMGCFDSFGAESPAVPPNKTAFNSQYGTCLKTPALKALMASAHLSPVWENYCLKSTQVDYTTADGTPYVLGNSVIEGIVGNGTIAASSCITCHAYASFGPAGKSTVTPMLPFNPTGKPIEAILAGSQTFAFMWGLLNAPPP
jgi:hypothetical protein